jgi:flagellar motor switch/type III secretory pathway protein FliN
LSHEAVRETLEQAVATWNGQWFVTPGVVVADLRPATRDARPDNDGNGWRVYRTALAVRAARGALPRLVGRALDLRADAAGHTAADLRLLAAFEEKLLESLTETLERALGVGGALKTEPERPADPIGEQGGVLVSLTDPSGREALTLAIPSEVVFRYVKASQTAPSAKRTPLRPLTHTLADVKLAFEARIGKVELTLAELNELAVGDVLVLDRRVDETVDIAGVYSQDVFAKAVLTNVGDGLALKFNE